MGTTGRPRMPIRGRGVNDAPYITTSTEHGRCPYYAKWLNMFTRCYSKAYKSHFPTYNGCEVSEEWYSFMAFREWMEDQDWEGKQLDKDIISNNGKLYSPDNCAFVTLRTNSFILDGVGRSLDGFVGCHWVPRHNRYYVQIGNPFTGKTENLGFADSKEEGHALWKIRKHEISCLLAEEESDSRVVEALRTRYL